MSQPFQCAPEMRKTENMRKRRWASLEPFRKRFWRKGVTLFFCKRKQKGFSEGFRSAFHFVFFPEVYGPVSGHTMPHWIIFVHSLSLQGVSHVWCVSRYCALFFIFFSCLIYVFMICYFILIMLFLYILGFSVLPILSFKEAETSSICFFTDDIADCGVPIGWENLLLKDRSIRSIHRSKETRNKRKKRLNEIKERRQRQEYNK